MKQKSKELKNVRKKKGKKCSSKNEVEKIQHKLDLNNAFYYDDEEFEPNKKNSINDNRYAIR